MHSTSKEQLMDAPTTSIATAAAATTTQDPARVKRRRSATRVDQPARAAAIDEIAGAPIDDSEPPQYSRGKVLGIWAAAAAPMGVLAWLVAPWLRDRIGGRDPFIEALLICFNVGLIWELALTLILVRRETGRLQW